jgi:hypothetical protein
VGFVVSTERHHTVSFPQKVTNKTNIMKNIHIITLIAVSLAAADTSYARGGCNGNGQGNGQGQGAGNGNGQGNGEGQGKGHRRGPRDGSGPRRDGTGGGGTGTCVK